ncbi:hypothetical protein [Pseudonocardia sp. NPDC049154]|uniref:hypothetical protein n=1 Tax=Pseudonocardia sp. NPDC049154 TaxID=3155501 RepID=UPI0033DB672C
MTASSPTGDTAASALADAAQSFLDAIQSPSRWNYTSEVMKLRGAVDAYRSAAVSSSSPDDTAPARTVPVEVAKLTEIAATLDEVLAYHREYDGCDEDLLVETARQVRLLAAGPPATAGNDPAATTDELAAAADRLDAAAERAYHGGSRFLRALATDLRDARGAVGVAWARPTACALLGMPVPADGDTGETR